MAKSATNAEVRTYELTYLVSTSYTDSEVNKIADEVTKLIAKHSGTMVKNDNWGKKKMAYRIKHNGAYHSEAYYTHMVFSLPSDQIQAFEKAIYLQTNIVRHLVVVAESAPAKTEAAAK